MANAFPVVIQGGMGVGVSSWQMAREVSQQGQLGVVSGTALDAVLARRLQDGDEGDHRRRAMAHFPSPAMAQRVLATFFRDGGRQGKPYRPNPTLTITPTREAVELSLVGNFVEVWLAKEGHDGVVGINFLEKIQMATPAAALGAMLGGVDYVLMGAGIPREIPRLLRDFAAGRPGSVNVDVHGRGPTPCTVDPVAMLGDDLPATLHKPDFLAIISVHSLATYLYRDEDIRPEGFVVEGPRAGGHSAPPRGKMQLDEAGEPVYGARDLADVAKIAAVGLPFWLAGGFATPNRVKEALEAGAAGVQCGTIFALSEASGLESSVRAKMLEDLRAGKLHVRNDPLASPTGFPFKVADVAGTQSEENVYLARPRLCDLSYLRQAYVRENGSIGYRCASEPIEAYQKKGGLLADTVGRKCLCNALVANVGIGQTRKDGYVEQPAVTLGQDLEGPTEMIRTHPDGWTPAQAIEWLLSELGAR